MITLHSSRLQRTETCWISIYEILSCYVEVREHVLLLLTDEMKDTLLTRFNEKNLGSLLATLSKLESGSKNIEKTYLTISYIGTFLYCHRLSLKSANLPFQWLKNYLVKIVWIRHCEKKTFKSHVQREARNITTYWIEWKIYQWVYLNTLCLGKRKMHKYNFVQNEACKYIASIFIVLLSNKCERPFLRASGMMTDYWKCMRCTNLESQIFRNENWQVWLLSNSNELEK